VTVNQRVLGSSPRGGAIFDTSPFWRGVLILNLRKVSCLLRITAISSSNRTVR